MRSVRRPTQSSPLRGLRLLIDLAVLAVVVVGLGGVALGRGLPLIGHPVFVVAGPSMEPAIDVGAAVVLETVAPDALRVGDVVSLRSGPARAVFTHRIVRIAERDGTVWLETRGDANAKPDPSLTPAADVIGRVVVALPIAGYALTVLTAPSGVVFVLSTGILLLLAGWLLESIARDRRDRAGAVTSAPTMASVRSPSRGMRRA